MTGLKYTLEPLGNNLIHITAAQNIPTNNKHYTLTPEGIYHRLNETQPDTQPRFELIQQDNPGPDGAQYRIRALRTFVNGRTMRTINAGQVGGWVSGPDNLCQEGTAWIGENAAVTENARLRADAYVDRNARIGGHARVYGKAYVSGDAVVTDFARVEQTASVYEHAWVGGDETHVCDGAVKGRARVGVDDSSTMLRGVDVGGSSIVSNVSLYGGCFESAHITGGQHVVQIATEWGTLSFHRVHESKGVYQISVGCRRLSSFAQLRDAARDEDAEEWLQVQIDGFEQMCMAVMDLWEPKLPKAEGLFGTGPSNPGHDDDDDDD